MISAPASNAGAPVVGPSKDRYLTSYRARRTYKDAIQFPPEVPGVKDAIDIHCHCHEGQQDALAVAKHASVNGMKGLLYKTIVGRDKPVQAVRRIQDALNAWCETEGVTPITCWSGYNVAPGVKPPSAEATRAQLEEGVDAVWMPVAMHANTLNRVGGRQAIWDPNIEDKYYNTEPLPWEEALKIGHYLLDEQGKLKSEIQEIFRMIADFDRAVFFAHATHPEMYAMAEMVDKLGIKKAVIDHPFSPFVDLSPEQMKQMAGVGIFLNFTYDELSPLLGVDPQKMYDTIRFIGLEQVCLSSDAGEPLFPNSVEAMRQVRAFMRAYGMNDEEVRTLSSVNPGRVVGVDMSANGGS